MADQIEIFLRGLMLALEALVTTPMLRATKGDHAKTDRDRHNKQDCSDLS